MLPQKHDHHSKVATQTINLNRKELIQFGLNVLNILGILISVIALYWGFKAHIFTSEDALRELLNAMGPVAPYGFIVIQIIQTVIPIIPGALTIPMGTMVFGVWHGFFLNFAGIMIGSVINFLLARKFGRPLVEMLVNEKTFNKYIGWLDSDRFDKLFAFGMFFPISPDDILCYLAGLSNITFKKYSLILLLAKPLNLFIYSYGMTEILTFLFQLI